MQTAALSELVEADALGRPWLNGGYRGMRLGVVNVLVCSERQGVACISLNCPETVVGTEELEEELGQPRGR